MASAWFDDNVKPLISGYETGQRQTFIRSTAGTGRARNRRVRSDAPYSVTAVMLLTERQFRLFEAWWRAPVSGAGDGQNEFLMPVRTAAGGAAQLAALATAGYSEQYVAQHWRVTLPVQLVERPQYGGDVYEYDPESITYADAFDVAMTLED